MVGPIETKFGTMTPFGFLNPLNC